MRSARTYLLCVTIIFWSVFSGGSSSQGQGCDPGWYGPDCHYKCRCADINCSNGGSCRSCQGGWFGPECQYVDLIYSSQVNNTEGEITDGNDTTCLKKSLQTVRIELHTGCQFTWLRVNVAKPEYLHFFKLLFWDPNERVDIPCPDARNATIDERTLDIYCNLGWGVRHVIVHGQAVEHLCSVYVSGGRNVALRQNTSQSTTFSEVINQRNQTFTSEKAVDGNTSGQFWRTYTCSSTTKEGDKLNTATWNLTLNKPMRVNRYVIHCRTDKYLCNEMKFHLDSFAVNYTEVFSDTITDTAKNEYRMINTKEASPISHVSIRATNDDNILSLCEVELYGDSACEPDRYGFECEHTCHCAGGEACFVSTGRCPSGCANGFTGETCDQPSPNSPNPVTIGANVGAILGAVLTVLILLVLFFVVRRKRNVEQEAMKVVAMTKVLKTDNENDNMQAYETTHTREYENDNLEHVYSRPHRSDYVKSGVDHVYEQPK